MQAIAFEQAFSLLQRQLVNAAAAGPNRIAMLTETVGQNLSTLFSTVLAQYGAHAPLVYEPYAVESLKAAYNTGFGQSILPGYRLDRADLLVGFGADFLETWLSPVEYARKFKAMNAVSGGQKGRFVHVGPYQSLTGANADKWIACRPGSEAALILALVRGVMNKGRGLALPPPFRSAMQQLARPYTPEKAASVTDVPAEDIRRLVAALLKARRPLVLPTQTTAHGAASLAADLGTVLLNLLLDPQCTRFDFDQRHQVETANPLGDVRRLLFDSAASAPSVLLLHNVNPAYTFPDGDRLAEKLDGGRQFVIAFSNFMDETAAAADLVFPTRMPLESWDAYESKLALVSTLQPAAGPINDAPQIGDVFLRLLPPGMQWGASYKQFLMQRLADRKIYDSKEQWLQLIQSGGRFVADRPATHPDPILGPETVAALGKNLAASMKGQQGAITLQVAPSLRFFDGRGSNRPWLPEIPEAISQVSWQTMAFVSAARMQQNAWSDGDVLKLESQHGQVEAQVYGYSGLHADVAVIPAGQGHTRYGRYATDQGVNPLKLLG
ncbi:MAG: molybdopterin-dependent oxidoreductase, partial [Desulfosarcinaceae bacterium]